MKRLLLAIFLIIGIGFYNYPVDGFSPYGGTSRNPNFDSVAITSTLSLGTFTVATRPAATTANQYITVTDGATAADCTTGGGSSRVLCRSTGSVWEAAGSGAITVPTSFSVIASGTAATIGDGAPSTELDFGTQDPTLVLTGAGSKPFLLTYHVRPNLAAATFAANQKVTCWLYRTNNTAAIIPNTTRVAHIPVATTETIELSSIDAATQYTTSGTNDDIECRCQLSAAAGAGSVTALGASIEALGMLQ